MQLRNSFRAFISVTLLFASLGLIATGAVLFLTPPGRIANWTGWAFAGLTKAQWQGLHQWSAALFVLSTVLHVWLNWRPLISYFRLTTRGASGRRWAWAPALVLCGVVAIGSASGWRAFEWLPEWSEVIKNRYDEPSRRGPTFHAELLSLRELAEQEGVPLDTALARLEAAGVSIDPDTPLGDEAGRIGKTPQEIHTLATGSTSTGAGGRGGGGRGGGRGAGGAGRGAEGGSAETVDASRSDHGEGGSGSGGGAGSGRMTIAQAAEAAGITSDQAVERLKAAGIEATAEDNLRDLADLNALHPRDVYDAISGE